MIKETSGLFRCDCSLCKNFAEYEIVVGGFKGSLGLCEEHFMRLASEFKQIQKQQQKSQSK